MWSNFHKLQCLTRAQETRDFDQLLQKRASPKFDVESIRHSDKRDLRLVPSENFLESLPGRSQSGLPQSVQDSEHYKEREKCFTTEGLDSLVILRRTT